VHLVKDHEFVAVVGQIQLRLSQFAQIAGRLQIEVDKIGRMREFLAHGQGQRRLAHLARAQQCHGGRFVQGPQYTGLKCRGIILAFMEFVS
jgi:hypothetical protein